MKLYFGLIALILCFIGGFGAATFDLTDIINRGANKVDEGFSCSKYDGVAACYHENWEKRDLMCKGGCWENRWSYEPWFGGKCYCCKCG